MSLSGQLALVTGGARGIGEAVCRVLAAEGATIVAADKNFDGAQQVADSLPGDAKHCARHVDVADSSSVQALFQNISSMYSEPLSIVVNCAGIIRRALLTECTDELFDDVTGVNLKGTFFVTRAASQEMLCSGKKLPAGGASIVNVSSVAATICAPAASVFCAAKAGVVALTKSAAKELAAHGIRCNVVVPGWVDTPMIAALPKDYVAKGVSDIPLKRLANPHEIAEAIKFLCSPKTSSYITGAAIEVAGGLLT